MLNWPRRRLAGGTTTWYLPPVMSPAPRLSAAVALAALISVALVSCGSDVVNLLQPKASAGADQGGSAVTAGAPGSDGVAGMTSGGVGGSAGAAGHGGGGGSPWTNAGG